jgi:hypothetical protein
VLRRLEALGVEAGLALHALELLGGRLVEARAPGGLAAPAGAAVASHVVTLRAAVLRAFVALAAARGSLPAGAAAGGRPASSAARAGRTRPRRGWRSRLD